MGRLYVRSLRVVAQALTVGVLIVVGTAASASDSRPSDAAAAIRRDLPILLAGPLSDQGAKATAVVDIVLTDGSEAVATWHAPAFHQRYRGLVALHFVSGRWRWRAATASLAGEAGAWTPMSVPGQLLSFCGAGGSGPPSARAMLMRGFISRSFAEQFADKLKPSRPLAASELVLCDPSPGDVEDESTNEGYDARFLHEEEYPRDLFVLTGRGPRNSEPSDLEGAEPVYVFTFSATKPVPVKFPRGSTFSVWFPFVLDRSSRYILTVRDIFPEIQPVAGKLKNNMLTFNLPTFSMPAGTEVRGEISATR